MPELPCSSTAEEAVLGSMLIDPACFPNVAAILDSPDFYYRHNRDIYNAICETAESGDIDIIAVGDALGDEQGELGRLLSVVPSALRVMQYAEIVRDHATRRRLITAAGKVAKAGYDTDTEIDEAQATAEEAVLAARRDTSERRGTAREVAGRVYERLDYWQKHPLLPGETRGLATGMSALDKALGGLQSGVYVVAGRPSIGKSAFLLQMVEGIASRGKRCLLFVLEANAEQTMARLVSGVAQVSLQSLRQETVTPEQYREVMDTVGALADWPLTIVDRATVRPPDVLAEARRAQVEHGDLAAVFIDGLWLMTPTKERENRTQSLGSVSRAMKRIQRELDIPLVMAHQLNRSCEIRGDRRPLLADLRDTGDIEQDTDVALMLYREGYYDSLHPDANVMEAWIRKNRLGGRAGECAKFYWKGEWMRCLPLDNHLVPMG